LERAHRPNHLNLPNHLPTAQPQIADFGLSLKMDEQQTHISRMFQGTLWVFRAFITVPSRMDPYGNFIYAAELPSIKAGCFRDAVGVASSRLFRRGTS
jgi:hypothetical protein